MAYPIDINGKALLKLFFVPDITSYYSPAYSWFVNQAGHALLGVVFAIALVTGVFSFSDLNVWQSWLLTLAFCFTGYGIKEIFDYRKVTARDTQVIETLKFSRVELFKDMAADWFFVNIGVITGASVAASFLTAHQQTVFAAIIALGLCVAALGFISIGRYYIVNKMLWQYSKLPQIKDLAHCPPEVLKQHRLHFKQQISLRPASSHYMGSFQLVHDILCGLARRRMVHLGNKFRRVRYWQAQALIEAIQPNPDSIPEPNAWSLNSADVHIVWIDGQQLPELSAEQRVTLNQSVWLLGSLNAQLPSGWSQLKMLNEVDLGHL